MNSTIKVYDLKKLVKRINGKNVIVTITRIAKGYLSVRAYDRDGLAAFDNTHTSLKFANERAFEMLANHEERVNGTA